MPLSDLFPSWKRHLSAEGKSASTLKTYLSAARSFASVHDVEPSELRRMHIEDWMEKRREQVSGTTLNIEWRALHQLLRWLLDEGEISTDPMARLKRPKPTAQPPEVYSPEDFAVLLAACLKARSKFVQTRDQAILGTLWDTGVRRTELVNILLENTDLDSQTIRLVTTKSGRPRTVPISRATVSLIDRYIRQRRKMAHADLPFLFIGQRGVLLGNGLYQALREIEKNAGFKRVIRPHIFRHSWANEMLKAGLSPLDTSVLAGWKDMQMLSVYGSAAKEERALEAAKKLRP